jgi:diamine N-acetyltransferase
VEVELREVDDAVRAELVRGVLLTDDQLTYVSDVEESLQEAAEVPEANPWCRGVYDDGVPVGFVMIAWDVPPTDGLIGPWFLWKLLVDRDHQRRGYGEAVLDLVVQIVRDNGGTELFTSYTERPGGPGPFYARLGFVPTGEHQGEVLAVKTL